MRGRLGRVLHETQHRVTAKERWVSQSARPNLQALLFYGCTKMTTSFDTIIIGAGAAGCVLASPLSARSPHSILLIEAGQDTPPGKEPPTFSIATPPPKRKTDRWIPPSSSN